MSKEKIIVIGGVVLLVLGLGLFFLLRGNGGSTENTRFDNMLLLAEEYAAKGEYDLALELINDLLLEDPSNEAARSLRDRVLDERKQQENRDREAELEALRNQNDELAKGLQELSSTLQSNQEDPSDKARRLEAEEEAKRKKLLQQQQVDELIAQAWDAIDDREFDKAIDFGKEALYIMPYSFEAQKVKKEAERLKREAESEAEKRAREEKEMQINSLLDRAERAIESGDYAGARRVLDEVLEMEPDNARAHSLLGQSWFLENQDSSSNRQKAKDNLEKSLAEDPQDWETHYFLGQIAESEGDDVKAIQHYQNASNLNGNSPEIFYSLGILQFRNKLYKEALASFQKVESLDRTYEGNAYAMGLTFNRLGDKQSGLDSLLYSCELRPEHGASFYETGNAYSSMGNQGQAINYLTKATQIKPDARYYRALGGVFSLSGDYLSAIDNYTKALDLDPNRAKTMNDMALCYINTGDYTTAMSWSAKAIQKEPSNARYLYTMGEGAEKSGLIDQAVEFYKKSASLDYGYAKPRVKLGNIMDAKGDYMSALQYLQEAYKAEPTDVVIWNSLGNVFLHLEQYANSIKWYEKAVSSQSGDGTLRYNLALGYIETEENEKAVVQLEKVIELNPQHWNAYHKLANIYYTMGNKEKAKEVAEELLKKNPSYENKEGLAPLLS